MLAALGIILPRKSQTRPCWGPPPSNVTVFSPINCHLKYSPLQDVAPVTAPASLSLLSEPCLRVCLPTVSSSQDVAPGEQGCLLLLVLRAVRIAWHLCAKCTWRVQTSVCFHVVFSAVNWSEGTAAALDLDKQPTQQT